MVSIHCEGYPSTLGLGHVGVQEPPLPHTVICKLSLDTEGSDVERSQTLLMPIPLCKPVKLIDDIRHRLLQEHCELSGYAKLIVENFPGHIQDLVRIG